MKTKLVLAAIALATVATSAQSAFSINISFGRPVAFHPPVVVAQPVYHPPMHVCAPVFPVWAPPPVVGVRPVPPPHRPVVVLAHRHYGQRWADHRWGWDRGEPGHGRR